MKVNPEVVLSLMQGSESSEGHLCRVQGRLYCEPADVPAAPRSLAASHSPPTSTVSEPREDGLADHQEHHRLTCRNVF